MAIVGFGTTLSGASVGAVTGIKECAVGGKSINVINYALLSEPDRSTHNLQGVITSGPITATVVFNKAVYDALVENQKTIGGDVWTLTDVEGNVWSGQGFITDLGEISNTVDSENNFTLEITPESLWEFTPSS